MEGQISLAEYMDSRQAPVKLQMEYPIEPLPCPFCGTELKEFPKIMVVVPVHSEEYLLAKLNKGHFLGTDNWFHVRCIQCGASGARGLIEGRNRTIYVMVRHDELIKFLENNQNIFDAGRIEPYGLGYEPEWLHEKRLNDRNKHG